jgi:protein arginine kinase
MDARGPHTDIVLSSRIRLARNVDGISFPHRLSDEAAEQVIKSVEAGVSELNRVGLSSRVEFYRLNKTPALDRKVLVEKHLISPMHAGESKGRAVAISEDEAVSIMVNEEDHLRIQVLISGLELEGALRAAMTVDDALEGRLTYAFQAERGYLTACPTNLGTGMRASVMMHLPGLVLTQQAAPVFRELGKGQLTVRGLYGEGTEAVGNIFQISNQHSLGKSEEEIIEDLTGTALKVIQAERVAREHLSRQDRAHVEDRIGRAYGILSHARIITSEEAMRLFSDVRLGIDLGVVDQVDRKTLNELMVATRPAFLQKMAGRELTAFERDLRRAALIRQKVGAA